jgi:predicted metal-dependent phosphoesterase TrpH
VKIDLHIHTRTCSDGNLSIEEVFKEAKARNINLIAITDHDSIDCQERAIVLAKDSNISYITGVELNVTFNYPEENRNISLDLLGYQYDINNKNLKDKLQLIKEHRKRRGYLIFERLNAEFHKEGIKQLSKQDIDNIQANADGVFGRPHIAEYLIKQGIVENIQEAFEKYLAKCNIPKYPLSLAEASNLIRNAGGRLILAHPNDPNGTSLLSITPVLEAQTKIIKTCMLEYIDGIECWHIRNNAKTTAHYIKFSKRNKLLMTGGSDCHQRPLVMGTIDIPDWVATQFGFQRVNIPGAKLG